ncbi:MAG: hypothetical protein FWE36_05975 [Erysipelotrichales bacterium]|nr:hypothetical protein [Erysipelotrichales bacterium]
MRNNALRELTLMAFFAGLMLALKYLLIFLPNVQVISLLIILAFKVFGFKKTAMIVLVYVTVDSLILSMNLYYFVLLVGWLLLPLLLLVIKSDSELVLAIVGAVHAVFYCLLFAVFNVFLIMEIDFRTYIILDIPYMLILMVSAFVSVYWLYRPLKKAFDSIINENIVEDK